MLSNFHGCNKDQPDAFLPATSTSGAINRNKQSNAIKAAKAHSQMLSIFTFTIIKPPMDPYKKLRISLNPDGSLTRHDMTPTLPPSFSPSSAVLSKDIPLNPTHKTSLRLFLPNPNPNPDHKLPLILYFHGGGFVLYSPATAFFHSSSSHLASSLPAIILSVDYRLAPEHRLPAAYDDAADALLWLLDQSRNPTDPWLKAHADFSNCFLMGSSSGGNIVLHLGLRALDLDLRPLNLSGLILNQPFFGGKERTESEVRLKEDMIVPLPVADLLWELALPEGTNRDHEYSNPLAMAIKFGRLRELGRVLVRGYIGDPLIDRQRGVVRMMEEAGVGVTARVEEEGFHGVELFDEEKREKMVADVKNLVYEVGDTRIGDGLGQL